LIAACGHVATTRPHSAHTRSKQMMDLAMVALALAFFALSVGYTIACDRM